MGKAGKYFSSVIGVWFLVLTCHAQNEIIQLYKGAAPGSGKWNWSEKEFRSDGAILACNVTRPSLEVFLPDDSLANGTSVIICPGGGFYVLEIEREGRNIARWLNARGVAAFVLHYRLMKSETDDPQKEMFAKASNTDRLALEADSVITMAMKDLATATNYVRANAMRFRINPERVGIIGFSAGGTLAAALAYNYETNTRPAFAAAIYPFTKPVKKKLVQKNAPPLFIAAASDDQLGFHIQSTELYLDWVRAGHSAELHVYGKGGHGFVAYKEGLPVDGWIDRWWEWLKLNGF